MLLRFEIRSWWQVGTGTGVPGFLDSVVMRDSDGLPLIPGKQVKGLCRDAVMLGEELGILPAQITEALFGSRSPPGQPLLDHPRPAALRFGDARVPPDVRAHVVQTAGAAAAHFFSTLRTTAIEASGVPRPHSLRTDEVAIPVDLFASVEALEDGPSTRKPTDGWEDSLSEVLSLITAVGGGRTRGLGRVRVTRV
jgi:CRISPR/Cas system CMR subunit Cmr4 (Cas7 group RAMP superfamily)